MNIVFCECVVVEFVPTGYPFTLAIRESGRVSGKVKAQFVIGTQPGNCHTIYNHKYTRLSSANQSPRSHINNQSEASQLVIY